MSLNNKVVLSRSKIVINETDFFTFHTGFLTDPDTEYKVPTIQYAVNYKTKEKYL